MIGITACGTKTVIGWSIPFMKESPRFKSSLAHLETVTGRLILPIYSSGKLIRRFVLEDPDFNKDQRVLVEDFGQPLACERPLSEGRV